MLRIIPSSPVVDQARSDERPNYEHHHDTDYDVLLSCGVGVISGATAVTATSITSSPSAALLLCRRYRGLCRGRCHGGETDGENPLLQRKRPM